MLAIIEEGLKRAGYLSKLLIPRYPYADFSEQEVTHQQVALAAFAREPVSAQTACIGVTENQSPKLGHRHLGAPILIETQGNAGRRWKNTVRGPELIDEAWLPLECLIRKHQTEWAPERIYRAKTEVPIDTTAQLDFVDVGLLPAIEEEARAKLHALISRVVEATSAQFRKVTDGAKMPENVLYPLIFRQVAAKLLRDKKVLNGLDLNHAALIERWENFGHSPELDFVDKSVLEVAADGINSSFPFSNLSVDTLAYVYEYTMVTPETRQRLSIHLTPSYLADYIVSLLPLSDIPLHQLIITDPMCGRGTFLLAALRRLRRMLPTEWSPQECHAFFLSHIRGRDIDQFAVEVTRLSLTLADLPYPNGWDIQQSDVYEHNVIEEIARDTTVLLTNPPFETFDKKEQHILSQDVTKPAELILRALPSLPDGSLVGLVLPAAFLDGRRYVKSRDLFRESFEIQEILALPDKVFDKADSETAVLLAKKCCHPASHHHISYRRVVEKDFPAFEKSKGESVSWEDQISAEILLNTSATGKDSFLIPILYSIWKRLEHLPKLGDFVDLHKGVEYERGGKSVKTEPFPSSIPGVDLVGESLRPFSIGVTKWISDGPRRGEGGSWSRPWAMPKILANVAPRSRGPWRLIAARDENGLVATERFFVMWQTSDVWTLPALVAFLNSAVANAFVFDHDGKRITRGTTLKKLPLPPANSALLKLLEDLSLECEIRVSESADADLEDLLLQIDSELLKAYDLPPREERRLLDFFQGEPRPGCRSFNGYYPENFVPSIPLHMLLSTEYQKASADRLVAEMPRIDDEKIAAMLSYVLEED